MCCVRNNLSRFTTQSIHENVPVVKWAEVKIQAVGEGEGLHPQRNDCSVLQKLHLLTCTLRNLYSRPFVEVVPLALGLICS